MWPASAALDDGHRLVELDHASASATQGADPAKAIDDDAVTRWTAGATQEPGQALTVDLGATRPVSRLALDTGAITDQR